MKVQTRVILWAQVVLPALYVLGCAAAGAIGATAGVRALSQYPRIAEVFAVGVAGIAGVGGLWNFWFFADGVAFIRRGYRLRHLPPREYWRWRPGAKACVYEEWTSDAGIRQLPFVREVLADGYPAPSRVHLPSEDTWDSQVPAWATHRRAEIVKRISECADHQTQFADLEGPSNTPVQPASGRRMTNAE